MSAAMVIPRRKMAEEVPSWLERVHLPQMSELKGEVKVIHTRIDGLGEKMEGAERRLESRIGEVDKRLRDKTDEVDKRLESKIDGVDMRLGAKIDGLDKRLDTTRRLAVVEAQLKELRAKE
jgi:tetrahydromethanopterin S-methyltransferase subunit G